MTAGDEERKQRRDEGRAMACEGIMRTHFGRRGSAAGSEALRRLRISQERPAVVRLFWPQSTGLKVALAAAAVLLAAVLLYALTGSVEPGAPDAPDNRADGQDEPSGVEPGMARAPEMPQPVRRPLTRDRKKEQQVEKTPEAGGPAVLAQVGEVAGEVRVKRQGSEEWLTTGVLFCILPGDTITTDSMGGVRLDFEGGDFAYMNKDALVTVEEETGEVLFRLDRGEIYLEKETAEGSMAVDTGFGKVYSRCGRFGLRMSGPDKCELDILEGEVECRGPDRDYGQKYTGRMRASFERGKEFGKGAALDSEDSFKWAMKMRSGKRSHRYGKSRMPGRHGPPGDDGPRSGSGGMRGFFKKLIEQFDELDANGDGRLSIEESRLPEDFWNRLVETFDADGDGELSAEECRAIPGKMKERRGPGGRDRGGPQGERGGQDDK